MRAGVCTVQQALTPEAASIVKQAVSLARRRGHAQVTSLHVASAMLSSSTGLLRRACLQSHSHPLQCKALELCFNVALNRLPASTSSPLLGSQYSPYPSLSNALVAAFKRAQAHQRRGSIENQQQPILALKIEIEQLVISILDDPSVSRVMREAGFSSPQVKTNVEQAVSLEVCSLSPPLSSQSKCTSVNSLGLGTSLSMQSPAFSKFGVRISKPFDKVRNEDLMSLLDLLMNKSRRNNAVIVGECLVSAESVVRGLMDKFERGEVPGDLRYVQFISLPLFSLRNLSKDEIDQKLLELRCLVKTCVGRGVVLYLGDLKWVSEFRSSTYGEQRRNFYCSLEHMVMELRRLVCGFGESGRLWLMGIATFQTYIKCKTGHPSLESLWELHPLTIPVGSLGLSLNLDSDLQAQFKSNVSGDGSSWQLLETGVDKHLTCCTDCSVNFDREARKMVSNESINTTTSTSSSLPLWLQQYKEQNRTQTVNDQEYVHVKDLCKKWNSLCSSVHKHPHFTDKAFNFSSSSPPSSTSISSYDQCTKLQHQTPRQSNWPVIFEPKHSPKEHQFWIVENDDEEEAGLEPNLRMYMPERNELKPDLLSNPNSTPNSATSSEAMEDHMEGLIHQFKELNAENLKMLCDTLERKVPWQKDIIPEIVSTILQCRSGMMKRKGKLKKREDHKEETWLFFLGADSEGKEKIARELAKLVFGSQRNFISIGLSCFSLTRADSTDDFGNKRMRDEMGSSYLDRFAEAVQDNPHRIFFVEDVEQVDYCSQMGIKRAIESGSITLPSGDSVPLEDAIVIFSCESFSSMSRACSPPPNIKRKFSDSEDKEDDDELERKSPCVSLDLNIAIGDDHGNEGSVTDIGILDSVDRQIVFKIQEL